MVCKNCGAEMEEGLIFCTNCGASAENTVLAEETVSTETPAKDPGKLMGIIGMSLGIAACVFALPSVCCNPCYSFTILATLLGVAGAVLSVIGMKQSKDAGYKNNLAMIGMIAGIAGAALAIVNLVLAIVLGLFGYAASGFMAALEEMTYY